MKFKPLHDRVLVRRVEQEAKTAGGIIIPDTVQEKPIEGEVLAVGAGVRDEQGKVHTLAVKVGDRIVFGKWSGTEVKVYKTEDTAIEDVKKGHVSGLVGDVLSLIKIAEASNRLVLSQLTLKTKPLGFIVPAHSQLRSFVNKQLSDPHFEQALLSSCRKHFGMEGQKRCLI